MRLRVCVLSQRDSSVRRVPRRAKRAGGDRGVSPRRKRKPTNPTLLRVSFPGRENWRKYIKYTEKVTPSQFWLTVSDGV
jgi:hypothetical protein